MPFIPSNACRTLLLLATLCLTAVHDGRAEEGPGWELGSAYARIAPRLAYTGSGRDSLLSGPPPHASAAVTGLVRGDVGGRGQINDWLGMAVEVTAFSRTQTGTPMQREYVNVREAYGTLDLTPATRLRFGRINIGNGIAKDLNAVDYYRQLSRTIDNDSLFFQDRMLSRVGQIGAMVEHSGTAGTLQLFASPKLRGNTVTDSNATASVQAKFSPNLSSNLYSEYLLFIDGNGAKRLGTYGSYGVGSDVLLYYEGSVASRSDVRVLDAAARAFVRRNAHPTARWIAGVDWMPVEDLTLNAEYFFNGDGYSAAEARDFFNTLEAPARDPGLHANALDAIQVGGAWRRYARTGFELAAADRALRIVTSVLLNLDDGSRSLAVTARYQLADSAELFGLAQATQGPRRSEFGLPSAGLRALTGLRITY